MRKLKTYIWALVGAFALGVSLSGTALADISAAEAAELDGEAMATLEQFKANTKGAEGVFAAAKGILVCPKITKAGLGIGAEGGQCVLVSGAAEKLYYGSFGVKGGFIAGVQSHSMILALNSDKALAQFTSGDREWELGIDASVAVAKVGAGGEIDTSNLKKDIVSFIYGQKGLMVDASWKGSRFKKHDVK